MSDIILGFFSSKGGREFNEDRTIARHIKTAGGLALDVAIVTDGVGGRGRGERAAQLVIDTVLQSLQQAPDTDVPTILQQAVKAANQRVHAEAAKRSGEQEASSTVAVAVIQDGQKLFVANVGDSRVYLVRGDNITQLTMDQTFANVIPMQGKMSWEAARANPRAEVVMYALGPKPDVPVDLGFYVGTTDPKVANTHGRMGLSLMQGDTILVCSHGLTKAGQDGNPYITDEEILRETKIQESSDAAKQLVSLALGRNADDNVSVALMQIADPPRKRRALLRNPKLIEDAMAWLEQFAVRKGANLEKLPKPAPVYSPHHDKGGFIGGKIGGDVVSGWVGSNLSAGEPAVDPVPPDEPIILPVAPPPPAALTPMRLHTALPTQVAQYRAFFLAVAVRQPTSPTLAEKGLDAPQTDNMQINWPEGASSLPLRVQVSAAECVIHGEAERRFRLNRGQDSPVFYFQLIPQQSGKIGILIEVYQEEELLGGARVQTLAQERVGATERRVQSSPLFKLPLGDPALVALYRELKECVNQGELRTLCFEMGVEYEDLEGETRSERVLGLVDKMNRIGRLADLLKKCREHYPRINWEETVGLPSEMAPEEIVVA